MCTNVDYISIMLHVKGDKAPVNQHKCCMITWLHSLWIYMILRGLIEYGNKWGLWKKYHIVRGVSRSSFEKSNWLNNSAPHPPPILPYMHDKLYQHATFMSTCETIMLHAEYDLIMWSVYTIMLHVKTIILYLDIFSMHKGYP